MFWFLGGADDRKASGRTIPASGNHTSTTSLNSEGDNGYGSGQLTETKPLEPAYPPTDDDVNDQYQRDGKPKGKKEDEVAAFSLSEGSISEDQLL